MQTTTLVTKKSDMKQTQWLHTDQAPLLAGQVRLKIEHFAFTANNATYATLGEAMHYWQFFPQTDPQWGCIPVWGYAVVAESLCDGVALGERFYGYYPFASHVVVQPERVNGGGFVDGAANRASLAAVYNHYSNVAIDPSHHPKFDSYNALLRPLYITSYLIADFFADHKLFGANTIVISSASSKTAYGTAYALKQVELGSQINRPRVIGLTSTSNLAFTKSLGLYDEVLNYESIKQLSDSAPSLYLDFSGSAPLRLAVHSQIVALQYSCSIGMTHWQDFSPSKQLPGPAPILFFAPSQVKKRIADWGGAEFQNKVGHSMQGFIRAASNPKAMWMTVEHHQGQAAAKTVYDSVISGNAKAQIGLMVSL